MQITYIIWLFVHLYTGVAALTYWIHESCHKPELAEGTFIDAMVDVVSTAQSAHDRLERRNYLAIDYFQLLFMGGRENTDEESLKEVLRVLSGIASMTGITTRETSDVRIYCDNDARWTIVPDISDDPHPNSQRRRGVDQEWEDNINGMRMLSASSGCLDVDEDGELFTLGVTYKVKSPVAEAGENPNRATITICDLLLLGKAKGDDGSGNSPSGGSNPGSSPGSGVPEFDYSSIVNLYDDDMSQMIMDDFEPFWSPTIFHEIGHLPAFLKEDREVWWENKFQAVTNWEPIALDVSPQDAIMNTETYSKFAFIAGIIANKGYILDTDNIASGKLVHDPTQTN